MEHLLRYWMTEAYKMASSSPDTSTQNGAIILPYDWENIEPKYLAVVGKGCNRLPMGVSEDITRLQKPLKYFVMEHAERSAIYNAASNGYSTNHCVMFATWASCADCARAIICSGIKELYIHKQAIEIGKNHRDWQESINIGFLMLKEANIKIEELDLNLECQKILFNGFAWQP